MFHDDDDDDDDFNITMPKSYAMLYCFKTYQSEFIKRGISVALGGTCIFIQRQMFRRKEVLSLTLEKGYI